MSSAIRTGIETLEFFGPQRCLTCISDNNKCFVVEEVESCFHCKSEAECIFRRTVERTKKNTPGKNCRMKVQYRGLNKVLNDPTTIFNTKMFTHHNPVLLHTMKLNIYNPLFMKLMIGMTHFQFSIRHSRKDKIQLQWVTSMKPIPCRYHLARQA